MAAPAGFNPQIPTIPIHIPARDVTATKDCFQVFLDLFKEKGKDLAKGIGYTAGWVYNLFPNMPEGVKNVSLLMKDVKNLLSAFELPEKTLKLRDAVVNLVSPQNDASLLSRARAVVKEGASFSNSACDGLELSSRFIPITKEVLRPVGIFGMGATLVGNANGAIEQAEKIWQRPSWDSKAIFYLINAARDVSYVALAILVLPALIAGTTAVATATLACLTSALTFTMVGFFYERIVDPENKGMNVPNRVVDNFKRQVAFQRSDVIASIV